MDYKIFKNRFITGTILFVILLYLFLNYETISLYFFCLIYIIIFFEIKINFTRKKKYIYSYLLTSFIFYLLYLVFFYNKYEFILFILLVVIFDTFAYVFGSLFGRRKIFPKISPNKTYVGFVGGYLTSIIVSYLILINFMYMDIINYLFFSSIIIFFSFIGDLIESYFKRLSSIKDSSFLLPGHGGFFDRMDGLILPIIFMPFINFLL